MKRMCSELQDNLAELDAIAVPEPLDPSQHDAEMQQRMDKESERDASRLRIGYGAFFSELDNQVEDTILALPFGVHFG